LLESKRLTVQLSARAGIGWLKTTNPTDKTTAPAAIFIPTATFSVMHHFFSVENVLNVSAIWRVTYQNMNLPAYNARNLGLSGDNLGVSIGLYFRLFNSQ
jgi:hypothetical protein